MLQSFSAPLLGDAQILARSIQQAFCPNPEPFHRIAAISQAAIAGSKSSQTALLSGAESCLEMKEGGAPIPLDSILPEDRFRSSLRHPTFAKRPLLVRVFLTSAFGVLPAPSRARFLDLFNARFTSSEIRTKSVQSASAPRDCKPVLQTGNISIEAPTLSRNTSRRSSRSRASPSSLKLYRRCFILGTYSRIQVRHKPTKVRSCFIFFKIQYVGATLLCPTIY